MIHKRSTGHTLEELDRLDPPLPRTLSDWLRAPRHPDAPAVTGHQLGGAAIARISPAEPLVWRDDDR